MAVYLYHFSRPYVTKTGRLIYHYAGYTRHDNNPRQRLRQHVSGYGNALVAAAVMAGIKVRIIRLWPERGEFEQQLKRAHNLRRYCPICKPRLLREQRHKYHEHRLNRQQNHPGEQETTVVKTSKRIFIPDVIGPTPQALAKAARNARLEEKRRLHPCEACGNDAYRVRESAKWPSLVCNGCHSRLEMVRQYAAEDPDLDLLERFIRGQFACPIELVLELLEKETRDENCPLV